MTDEIIEESWQIKDRMAQEYGYDIDRLLLISKTGRVLQPQMQSHDCVQAFHVTLG